MAVLAAKNFGTWKHGSKGSNGCQCPAWHKNFSVHFLSPLLHLLQSLGLAGLNPFIMFAIHSSARTPSGVTYLEFTFMAPCFSLQSFQPPLRTSGASTWQKTTKVLGRHFSQLHTTRNRIKNGSHRRMNSGAVCFNATVPTSTIWSIDVLNFSIIHEHFHATGQCDQLASLGTAD